jgi:hypothetical protein
MKKLLFALLATGSIAIATPALSQVYFGAGPGGVGVGVGPGPGYYDDGYRHRSYDNGYRTYGSGVVVQGRNYRRCRVTVIRNEFGKRRRVERCW